MQSKSLGPLSEKVFSKKVFPGFTQLNTLSLVFDQKHVFSKKVFIECFFLNKIKD